MPFTWILSSAIKTVSAGAKTAFGKKSFTDNMKDERYRGSHNVLLTEEVSYICS